MSTRLSLEEEQRLLARIQAGDAEAEGQMIVHHLLPAYSTVNRYVRSAGLPKEDLEQEAALALLIALRKFDPNRGVRFVTYAMWWVRVRIHRACQRWGYISQEPPTGTMRWLEVMPANEAAPSGDGIDLRHLNELSPRRRLAIELVLGLNGHEPHTRPQLAAALGLRIGAANKLYIRAIAELRKKILAGSHVPLQPASRKCSTA
jgi:RNA polymerase sigma factor (sigma-70 family)